MEQVVQFLRKNVIFLLVILVVIGIFVLFQKKQMMSSANFSTVSMEGSSGLAAPSARFDYSADQKMADIAAMPPVDGFAPQPQVSNRLVIQNSYVSLLVNNVKEVKETILKYAVEHGGYMVSSDTNGSQESLSSTVTVRVPSTQLDETLSYFRSLSLRVVSEHLDGQDVTDQFVDIQKRIEILEKTLVQFEDLRDKSREISDLSNITQQILNIQSQIDNYKGQQQALEKNAQFVKITLYLSTDEIALPYQPDDNFRPAVIFKLAVRSLMGSFRSLLATLIWIGVYGIIWIPLVGIFFFAITRYRNKK